MRLLNRFIRWVSRSGAQRSVYHGAVVNRLTADWITAPTQSADLDVRGDHRKLVSRARDLAKNNPHVRRFLELSSLNVIGPDGIRIQGRIRTRTGGFDTNANNELERQWREWGRPEFASADGRSGWTDIEAQAVETWLRDGEALIRMLPGFDNPFGFAVQLLDPDQLDVDMNVAPDSRGTNEVRQGVEVDEWSRPVAYWIYTAHPSDYSRKERVRVPAHQIVHLYAQDRPNQTRGVTRLAPVMMRLNMLAGLEEAELVATRAAAAKMGFFVQDPETGAVFEPEDMKNARAGMEAEPGMMEMLPPGTTFHAWDPQHPTTAFQPFVAHNLASIAAGLDMSYASLTGDLTGVNFSSIRAGLIVERDHYRRMQKWVVSHLHRRVYDAWARMAILAGRIKSVGGEVPSVEFQPRGFDWVDPEKDINAAMSAVGAGMDSLTRLTAERGRDIEEVFADRQREIQLAQTYGVPLNTNPRKGANDGEDSSSEDATQDGVDRARKLRLTRGY